MRESKLSAEREKRRMWPKVSFFREKRDSNCYLLTRNNELERERRREVRFRERRIQLGKKLLTVFNASARARENA